MKSSLTKDGQYVVPKPLHADEPGPSEAYRSLSVEVTAAMEPVGGKDDPVRRGLELNLGLFKGLFEEYNDTGGFSDKYDFMKTMDNAALFLQKGAIEWGWPEQARAVQNAIRDVRDFYQLWDNTMRPEPKGQNTERGRRMISQFTMYLGRLYNVITTLLNDGVRRGADAYGDPEELTDLLAEAMLTDLPKNTSVHVPRIDGGALKGMMQDAIGTNLSDKGKGKARAEEQ